MHNASLYFVTHEKVQYRLHRNQIWNINIKYRQNASQVAYRRLLSKGIFLFSVFTLLFYDCPTHDNQVNHLVEMRVFFFKFHTSNISIDAYRRIVS